MLGIAPAVSFSPTLSTRPSTSVFPTNRSSSYIDLIRNNDPSSSFLRNNILSDNVLQNMLLHEASTFFKSIWICLVNIPFKFDTDQEISDQTSSLFFCALL